MSLINRPEILSKLRSRFKLLSIEEQLTLERGVRLTSDVDDLLSQYKIWAGVVALGAIGWQDAWTYVLPDERHRIVSMSGQRTAGLGVIDALGLYDPLTGYRAELNSGIVAVSYTFYPPTDLWLETEQYIQVHFTAAATYTFQIAYKVLKF